MLAVVSSETKTAGEMLEDQASSLDTAYRITWTVDKIGTAASIAAGGGTLYIALRETGKQVTKVQLARFVGTQLAVGVAKGFATNVALEAGGEVAVAMGANEEVTEWLVAGARAAKKWYNQFDRTPKSIQDRLTMQAAKEGLGERLPMTLGDPRLAGFEKWQTVGRRQLEVLAGGKKIEVNTTVHFIRDPQTGVTFDFKFTSSFMTHPQAGK
jgi:hypothetical protein